MRDRRLAGESLYCTPVESMGYRLYEYPTFGPVQHKISNLIQICFGSGIAVQ